MKNRGKIVASIALFCTKYLPSVALICCFLGGCAGGYQKTVDYAHHGAVELRKATLPSVTAVCEYEIDKCELASDQECAGYYQCRDLRRKIAAGFEGFQEALKAIMVLKPKMEEIGVVDAE